MIDKLKVFRGGNYEINQNIILHQPTLGEVCDFGELKYLSLIKTLCATPADRKVDIWESLHVFWDEIDEFTLFVPTIMSIKNEDLSIVSDDLDWSSFNTVINPKTNELVLRNADGVIIDRAIHSVLTNCLRQMLRLKKNVDVGFDRYTKEIMIEDDKDEQERLRNKPFESFLLPLISAMTNCEGFKYRHDDVWTMPIGAFMDSVERIQKHINYDHIMYGVYSGNVEYKKLNKKELDWMGDLS